MRFFFILSTICFENDSRSKKNSVIFHKEYICSFNVPIILLKLEKALIFPQFLEKVCNIYFDRTILRPDVQCRWKDGRTDGYKNSH